jgi:hypothetical protein
VHSVSKDICRYVGTTLWFYRWTSEVLFEIFLTVGIEIEQLGTVDMYVCGCIKQTYLFHREIVDWKL